MKMSKKTGGWVAGLTLCAAACVMLRDAVTNMESWAAVPYVVTQTAAVKRVESVFIAIRPSDGRITVIERYSLFDAGTNVLRSGKSEYSQSALADKLQANGETLARLKTIIKALASP